MSTFLFTWTVFLILSILIARWKRRSMIIWGLITLVLGPLGTLFAALWSRWRQRVEVPLPTAEEVAAIQLKVGDVVEGGRARIEIRANGIAIHRDKGGSNLLLHGMKGEKRISFSSISAVQLLPPAHAMAAGYIQFSLVGGLEAGRGLLEATKDENSVLFGLPDTAAMMALRDYVEARMGREVVRHAPNVTEELAKLADLRDRGVLTEEEFAARKAALLAR